MQNFRLEELLEEMLFNEKARGISQKTIKKHQKFLKLFFDFLKKEQIYFIEDVTPKSIRQFMLMKLEEGCAETYVNSHLRSIRAYFKYCVDEDYIRYDRNPCMRVKWVKERKVIIQTFNDMEIKEMLSVVKKSTFFKPQKMDKQHTGYQTKFTNQRDYLLLLILIDTGLRINEIMNLKDVHITNNFEGIARILGKDIASNVFKQRETTVVSKKIKVDENLLSKSKKENELKIAKFILREIETQSYVAERDIIFYVYKYLLKKKTKKDAEYLVKQCRANICKDYDLELIRVTNSIRDSYNISNEIKSRSIIYVKN